MEIGPTLDFFVFPANIESRGFAGKSFRGQICGHCLRPSPPSSSSYQGRAPLHNVLFVQYDAPVSKILGVFFWNLDSVLL